MQLTIAPPVITITGRLDSATAPAFLEAIRGYWDHERNSFVLDASQLEHLSVEGAEALKKAAEGSQERGGKMVVAAFSPAAREVCHSAGCASTVEGYATIEEGLIAVAIV